MDAIFEAIINFLTSVEGVSATIALVVEFLLRLIPSSQPLSILHIVSKVIRKVSDILEMLANVLDKILPQNTPPVP